MGKIPSVNTDSIKARPRLWNLFRSGQLRIRARLTACFSAIIFSMLAASLVAVWQFRRMTDAGQRLNRADQISLAALVVHLDVDTLRNKLAALADTHDSPEFAKEAVSLRRKFLDDVTRAQQMLTESSDLEDDPLILNTLQTVQVTLPSQVDSVMGLAAVNDWPAVRRRLADQVQGLLDLSSLLVERVDREVSRQRAEAIESAQRARRQLLLVLPATTLFTMLMAVLFGWHVTRTITEPLSQLYAGAQALAQGEFRHKVKVNGEDELATLGNAFNYAARRLRELYDGLRDSEEALRRSEKELRDVIETMPATVWRTSSDGSVDFINKRWVEFTGLPPEAALGWNWETVVHPEDRTRFVADWRAALNKGQSMESEIRLQQADGQYCWWFVRNVPLRDEQGKVVKWYGTAIDIEDRKCAEEAARQRERELREVIETIPAMAFTTLPDGSTEFVNRRFREYTGLTAKDAGLHQQNTVHPEDSEGHISKWQASLATGEPFENEVRHRGADGQYRWFLVRGVPLRDEHGEIRKWFGTLTDIEDRKQAEERLRSENVVLREEIDKASMFEQIVGTSPALRNVLARISKVAPTDSSVLITGETGTGKELVARAIHRRSRRCSRAFVSVNCASIPRDLIASELFGHEKGAFTGATQRRIGRFELAEGGTLFLDEVGELPAETQIALLRVLQEHEFERVGGTATIRNDVRVIAATNRDLEAAIAAGTFRSDLFYRLNVFPIEIPPLRQRREDIPLLVEYFIDRFASQAGKSIQAVNQKSLDLLQSYPWPGNIRELQNVIERSVIVCETEHFSVDESWLSRQPPATEPSRGPALLKRIPAEEKAVIEAALSESGGQVYGPSGAAAKLGIPRSTLEHKIRSLKINKNRFKTDDPSKSNSASHT